MTAPKPFELASTDRDTVSLGLKNLRTGVDETAVLRLQRLHFLPVPRTIQHLSEVAGAVEHLFGTCLERTWTNTSQRQKPL